MTIKPPTVRDQSPAVATMAGDWLLLSALIGGTRAMRGAKALLPQFPAEDDESYAARLSTAVLTNFFGRTCSIMASKPFSQEINTAKLSPAMQAIADDIDGQGAELQSFGETLLRGCLSHGVAGVFVDYPAGEAPATKAGEAQARRRPYWAMYPAPSILGFKAERIGSQWVLSQIRLLENVTEENGRFGERVVEQVRVLEPGLWELWRKDDKQEWFQFDAGATSIDYVPFQFFYGVQTGFGTGISPLLDLAYLNCEHWQSSSDQQTILHVARVPILFGKGFDANASVKIGSSSAVLVSDDKADLKYVEHQGHAIDAGRVSLQDLEDRMRQMGAELLTKRRGNVTATQVVSEGDANKCILQSIVEAFEDGLNSCLGFTGKWLGESAVAEIELFKDFGVDSLTDASAALLLDAAIAGKLSDETFFEEMRRRTVIDTDRQWVEEDARLKSQPVETVAVAPKLPIHPGKAD